MKVVMNNNFQESQIDMKFFKEKEIFYENEACNIHNSRAIRRYFAF